MTLVKDRKVRLPRRERLFVLHWNANGIRSSFNELAHLLTERTIDICMVQETRLLPTDSFPPIPGYVSLRRDRPTGLQRAEGRGGGLSILIKDDLPFCEVGAFRAGMDGARLEALAVEIQAAGGERFTFVNVYSPPTPWQRGTQDGGFHPEVLAVSRNHFFGGDWNCHSRLWDPFLPEDRKGEVLENWMTDHGLGCINDGSSTRVNRATGGIVSQTLVCVTAPGLVVLSGVHLKTVSVRTIFRFFGKWIFPQVVSQRPKIG